VAGGLQGIRACSIGDGQWLPAGERAEEWRALVTLKGVPVARVRLPHPGDSDEAFRQGAIDRHADGQRSYAELLERMESRLGVPKRQPKQLTCSVVVCTHRRPDMLSGLLEAVAKLNPRPHQLVVVDNDPGTDDVAALAQAAGATYIREPRRGLDNARRAGLAAASGDLVAFTDDDCLPSPRWLRDLSELFDDPRVAAVTGPAFAHELDTEAKLAFEESGGFGRGFHRRVYEWTNLSPPGATRAGAGANMILRRELAQELGELFPPELDAGTHTQSGGDLYALHRILAAGHRVVYDPGTYVLHRHRADLESMHRTFHGYGVGLSAALTKLLLEERELSTSAAWAWLVRQRLQAIGQGPIRKRIAREYLRGGVRGPAALWRARQTAIRTTTAENEASQAPPPAAVQRPKNPAVSVIVTTHKRPDALRRCVHALARQQPGTPPFELTVVNDSAKPLDPLPGVAIIETGGVGTGAARNAGARAARGELLLFLDDDLVPEPDLVARHAGAHDRGEDRVAIGYCAPRPRSRNLASLGAAAWWEDHYRALRDAASLTFMDVLSGNMSVPRATFQRIGGFDPGLRRREDWEWGIRALESGAQVVYEPAARAVHEFHFGTRRALAAGRHHGRADAALIARDPATAGALPVRWSYRAMLRQPLKAGLFMAFQLRPGQAAGRLALALLERAKARPTWACLFALMLGAAYERGRRDAGDPRRPALEPPVTEIELDSDDPVPAPATMATRVRLLVRGERVAEFSSYGGHWGGHLAEQIASAGHWEWWRRVEAATEPAGQARIELIRELSWAERDRAIRHSNADVVVITLHATVPGGCWIAQAAAATRAELVGVALGAGVDAAEPPQPITLHSRRTNPEPYPLIGRPPAYLALSRQSYELLGGFELALADLGDEAVVLELTERALEAHWLVARRDMPGLAPGGRAAALRVTRARAALSPPSLWPAARRLAAGLVPGGPSLSGGVAHAAAHLTGLAAAVGYGTGAPPSAPERSRGPASQRWAGRNRPSPAERPVTRSG
jgi:GT2 family glycosyltransferase